MVRALVTGPDGRDVLLSGRAAGSVRAGAVLGGGPDVTAVPYGIVELAVMTGEGAGAVHRLDVGTVTCGAGDVDVPLPTRQRWTLDVRCGGQVWCDDGAGPTPWPVGESRLVGGLDVRLRWCAPPRRAGEALPTRGMPLPDLLLDRIAGAPVASATPTWELGRDVADPVRSAAAPVADVPVLALTGARRHAYARALLSRLVAASDTDRVRLSVLAPGADDATRAAWAWTRWLPHVRTGDERVVRVGFDADTCARLAAEADARHDGILDVLVVDGVDADVAPPLGDGVAVLLLAGRVGADVPVVDLPGPHARTAGLPGVPDVLAVDLPDAAWADRLARALTRPEEDVAPSAAGRLVDLLPVDPADPDALARAWSATAPAETGVPLGVAPDGAPVVVDLRTHGPHALVAGTTGSGKSELLQTWVAALATVNPPEAMTFLLVDYKGGAAFAGCEDLPHVLGVVTDLDVGLAERALAGLAAEIHRREQVLRIAGVADVDALGPDDPPLARLVVMVDEFATLAGELPDFIDGLVDVARRGRSLGVHLVLATQRPGGAVSADIRANTSLRICLRVADAAESIDVLGLPDAVDLDDRRPGQALVRVGQNRPVPMQVARVTCAPPAPLPERVPYVFGCPLPVVEGDGPSDLARLAATATRLSEGRDVALPPSPWLPPLPEHLDLDDIDACTPDAIPFGLEDRPREQRRGVAELTLDGPLAIVGGARSGRTGALRGIAVAAARFADPRLLHLYVLDAGARGLADLDGLPHVGAVVARDEPDRLERLVTRLTGELDDRVQACATRRWRGIDDQHADLGAAAWPRIVVLVDRFDLLADAAEAGDDRVVVAAVERLAAEGARVGIVVVATGDRVMLTGRMASVFPDRLVLRLSDAYDYASLGLPGPAGRGVPGRGWRGVEGVETQVVDVPPVEEAPTGGAVERPAGGPFRIDPLPSYVTREEALALPLPAGVPEGALLVAVGGDEVGPRWIDADEYGPCALVTGRRRSGRSAVLVALAESALARGWDVVLVAVRKSPLDVLAGAVEGRVHGPFRRDEDAAALGRVVRDRVAAGVRVLVVADDVDLVPDGALLDELGALPGLLRDTGSLFVGSGEAEEIVAAFRGPAPALRRSRCGVMLAPQSTEDGEAFGVRLRRGQVGRALPPGAGFLVLDAWPERVQVVRSALLPESRRPW